MRLGIVDETSQIPHWWWKYFIVCHSTYITFPVCQFCCLKLQKAFSTDKINALRNNGLTEYVHIKKYTVKSSTMSIRNLFYSLLRNKNVPISDIPQRHSTSYIFSYLNWTSLLRIVFFCHRPLSLFDRCYSIYDAELRFMNERARDIDAWQG